MNGYSSEKTVKQLDNSDLPHPLTSFLRRGDVQNAKWGDSTDGESVGRKVCTNSTENILCEKLIAAQLVEIFSVFYTIYSRWYFKYRIPSSIYIYFYPAAYF
jgi:hypothetical protein